jgi:hypothetical protein
LTAGGGTSYHWEDNSTNPVRIITAPGTYSVTVTNANMCSSSTSVTVTENPLPSLGSEIVESSGTTSGDGIICAGDGASITIYGGTTYLWSTGDVSSTIFVTPASTTSYTVTVTDALGCTNTAVETITVNPLPTASITIAETSGTTANDGIICAGASATLTASGGTSYYWSTDESTPSITVNTAGDYTVTVTDANGCNSATTVTIVVNPLPTASIVVTETSGTTSNDGIICTGASATLTASGGTAYAWSSGQNTAAITVSTAGDYTVTVTDANGCYATSSATIVVNPLPTPSIAVTETSGTTSNDGIICTGASATLTASGGTSYAWNTGDNTAAITVTPANTTTYTVTVTNANGCSATATTTITVNPLPTAAITPNNPTICNGGSSTLTASGGTSYAWNTGAATAAITVSPTTTTTYTATVTNANGCTATATATVNVNPLPVITPTVTQPTTCVSADGAITLALSGAAGPYTFNWATPNGSGLNPTAQNQTNLTVGTYNVTVTVNATGCSSTASYTLTGPGGCAICPTVGALSATPSPVCQNVSVALNATGLMNMGITYGIQFVYFTGSAPSDPYTGGTTIATVPNGSLGGGGTTATTNTSFAAANTYYIYAILSPVPTDPTCRPSATTVLTVNALPTPSITETDNSGTTNNDGIICAGASATLTANGGTSYAWSTGATTAAITVSAAGTYTVTATNANG